MPLHKSKSYLRLSDVPEAQRFLNEGGKFGDRRMLVYLDPYDGSVFENVIDWGLKNNGWRTAKERKVFKQRTELTLSNDQRKQIIAYVNRQLAERFVLKSKFSRLEGPEKRERKKLERPGLRKPKENGSQ